MSFVTELGYKNIKRRSGRSFALILLSALLSAAVFGGSLVIKSLRSGLESYEARLGADIIVTPRGAASGGKLETILLQGTPGYFYMDESVLEAIGNIEGVEEYSPQFYLASASSGCCDALVQLIGFDPETDFSITPWISERYEKDIRDGYVVVGSNITIPSNRSFRFYNVSCTVAASLDKTGTGLDNAIYGNMNTIREMMESSDEIGFDYFTDVAPDRAVSSVLVNVRDGYDPVRVASRIYASTPGIDVTATKDMVLSVADGLKGISGFIGLLIFVIWLMALFILIVIYIMIVNERVGELAVLRISGAPKSLLSKLLLFEALFVSVAGSLIGTGISFLVVSQFADVLKSTLDLPLLLPGPSYIILLAVFSLIISAVTGGITSAVCAFRITSGDTALILREGA